MGTTAFGGTAMPASDFITRLRNFDQLEEADKLRYRIDWLEKKIVEILYVLVGGVALGVGVMIGHLVQQQAESFWISVPIGMAAWASTAWYCHKHAFRNAPPHIRFIDA
jgi:hypothetical protein